MAYVEVEGGLSLYYEVWGSGRPVVFLHGRGMSRELWQHQAAALRGRFKVVAFDLRGHGDSQKPDGPYTHEAFARDLRSLLEKLRLQNATLVGWSTGSFTILKYAELFGLRGSVESVALVGTTPVFRATPDFPHALSPEALERVRGGLEANLPEALKEFARFMLHRPREALVEWVFHVSLKTPLPVLLQTLDANVAMDYRPTLSRVDVPTLILQGRHDRVCPFEAARYMSERIPECRLVGFEESGHCPHLEEPPAFNRALLEFLAPGV